MNGKAALVLNVNVNEWMAKAFRFSMWHYVYAENLLRRYKRISCFCYFDELVDERSSSNVFQPFIFVLIRERLISIFVDNNLILLYC